MKPILIRSDYLPGEVARLCDAAIADATAHLEKIVSVPVGKKTIDNTLLYFEKAMADLSDIVQPLTFMGYVSTHEKVNKEGSDCEQKVNQYIVDVYTRKDLYESIKDLKDSDHSIGRLLFETKRAFEDNGLRLSDENLKIVRELKQKLATVESQFSTHLNQDQSTVEYLPVELEGIPKDFIDTLKKSSNGHLIVTTKEPDYIRVMENAIRSETRRKMLVAFENRAAKENTPLLEEAIRLRQKIAQLMGYKNWVDYRVHSRMAKNSEAILSFLQGLKGQLSKRNRADLAKLLKFKQEKDQSAHELNAWDLRYFAYQLKKRDYSLDDEVIREYFPADRVIQGLFQVYSSLLGVKYIEQTTASVWEEGVKLYQIRNLKDDCLIGYFYTDFIPRAGKYGHAAAFPLISGRFLTDKIYSHPVSAIVANFSPPENGKPILMKHEEVRTLFHEFGHIMHQTLTRAPFATLSGSNVDQDFVEAPSQMLENWVFSPDILSMISGHYLDPSKKLPNSFLQKIVEARDFNQGYFYIRQLLFGLLDMAYHTSHETVDTSQLYRDLHKELVGVSAIQGSHFPASFGHLMGGYDGGYYGYLWSEVYAEDMFSQFQQSGILSSEMGGKYRQIILEKGKMEEPSSLLEEFLGRKPNHDAFYKKLHITQVESKP